MTNRARTGPWVPAVIVGIASMVIAVVAALMLLGGRAVGATWDERIHAVMLDTYFSTGWYASPDWLVNGAPGPRLGDWPYYVYAPIAELVLHVVTALAGAEPWGGFSDSASAYAARHLGTAIIAGVGILAASLTVGAITRSWRWALLGGAVLASIPMWAGHGMFNVKDLPVGTGYTLVTLGFVLATRPGVYRSHPWLRVGAVAAIISGLLLAVGTRPASGLPMALTAVALIGLLLVLAWRRSSTLGSPLARAVDLIVAAVGAYVLLVLIYPKGFGNPYTLARETLAISGRFPVNDPVLTAGAWLPQPPPWTYLPTWFGAQLPLLVIAGALIALVWGAFALATRRTPVLTQLPALLVTAQALLLPLMAIAMQSTMYNAVRQFLFVVPAVAVLSTLGIRRAIQGLPRWPRVVGWVVVSVGLVVPVIAQIQLFPYGYTYFNAATALQPIDGRWATDYWRASTQELTRIIPPGLESCALADESGALKPCAEQSPFEPFWASRGVDARPGELKAREYWLVRENGGDVLLPPDCTEHDAIRRPLFSQKITIAQVLRCSTSS